MLKQYPLASFCIFTYNQETFIRDAIKGAFSQEYENLEIIISDDCSTDSTYDIIKSEVSKYKGKHIIRVLRNEKNLGIAKHVCKVLYEEAKGDIVLLAAGDDISLPTRTEVSVSFLQNHPEVSSLSVTSQPIDANGNELTYNGKDIISFGQDSIFTLADYIKYDFIIFSGDSRALRRNVIESFPPLEFSYAEDIYLFIRSFYIGSVALLRNPLVLYRQHSNSVMGKSRTRKKITKDDWSRYENAKKQIFTDFEYAIEKGYIKKEFRDIISEKLTNVIVFLKPQKKGAIRDIIYNLKVFILRQFNRFFPNLYLQVRGFYRRYRKI